MSGWTENPASGLTDQTIEHYLCDCGTASAGTCASSTRRYVSTLFGMLSSVHDMYMREELVSGTSTKYIKNAF